MITLKIPIKTVSEANKTGEHWTQKHKRHKAQRAAVKWYWSMINGLSMPNPMKLTFTRIAPRSLDSDNLQSSMKVIRDQICELITGIRQKGRADNGDRFQFEYNQRKGEPKEYAIEIMIESLNDRTKPISQLL